MSLVHLPYDFYSPLLFFSPFDRKLALFLDKTGDADSFGDSIGAIPSPLPPSDRLPVPGRGAGSVDSRFVASFSTPLFGRGDAADVSGDADASPRVGVLGT